MSYFHYLFLYIVIGIFPSIPIIAIYLFFSKKEYKDILKLPLFIFFAIMGWLLNNLFHLF